MVLIAPFSSLRVYCYLWGWISLKKSSLTSVPYRYFPHFPCEMKTEWDKDTLHMSLPSTASGVPGPSPMAFLCASPRSKKSSPFLYLDLPISRFCPHFASSDSLFRIQAEMPMEWWCSSSWKWGRPFWGGQYPSEKHHWLHGEQKVNLIEATFVVFYVAHYLEHR